MVSHLVKTENLFFIFLTFLNLNGHISELSPRLPTPSLRNHVKTREQFLEYDLGSYSHETFLFNKKLNS